MKVEQRTVYIAVDGEEFSTEQDALEHEQFLALENELRESDLEWYDIGPREVAFFILSRFKLERK